MKRLEKINPKEKREEKFKKAIDECVVKLKKINSITAIILFGSLARGDYSVKHSDIDLLVFLDKDKKDENLEKRLNQIAVVIGTKYKATIHLTFQYNKITEEDNSLIKRLMGEGRVLFNKGNIIISKEILGLKAYELIVFDTSGLKQLTKTKFSRLLHGTKLWYFKDKKKIIKQYKGLIDNENYINAGKGALLILHSEADKFAELCGELGLRIKSKGIFYR